MAVDLPAGIQGQSGNGDNIYNCPGVFGTSHRALSLPRSQRCQHMSDQVPLQFYSVLDTRFTANYVSLSTYLCEFLTPKMSWLKMAWRDSFFNAGISLLVTELCFMIQILNCHLTASRLSHWPRLSNVSFGRTATRNLTLAHSYSTSPLIFLHENDVHAKTRTNYLSDVSTNSAASVAWWPVPRSFTRSVPNDFVLVNCELISAGRWMSSGLLNRVVR
jgi:hypothetical protein